MFRPRGKAVKKVDIADRAPKNEALEMEVGLAKHRVLSVGQCSSDDYRLARVVRAELGSEMESAYTSEEALRKLAESRYQLVLVNRVIEGDGESGVGFIAGARLEGVKGVFMLVSDYADAQAQAVAAGAAGGFGKSSLGRAEVGEVLREALGEG